ncbi:Calponin-homology (CH) domain-containing protein [Caenorhabditis elegans]|uniref:Calponin-homology (CH) domain-containing protein n=1 Tax=Caenorhabditis elegans TaxID=6239 RepID=A0A4V6M3C1_CAEEL|nr:Calponin-homology (CH) domain-containing protein [Caenorhabditis elegans]VTW47491.1 Calponin-homology (CH) domain-containing protein [Caenorhabditis elegans]
MGKQGEEARQKWIDIQLHTFTNWINEQLQGNVIRDLTQDLSDGVNLIKLVEILQGRRYYGKVYDQDPTEIQKLMNVQMALDALREDGVKTVNIGSHDIVDGNEKLILGLIWCLVQRYQIACKTKIPPKKLVMAWIQSALPELKLTNFRTNWNDGIALSALLEYCQPGLCPEWRNLDPSEARENCHRALLLAERYLEVPPIISSDHLSSPHLDELSCLTYLSYFITKGAPGYRATLKKVSMLLPDCNVDDLEHSWSDGFLLAHLVEICGGRVPELERMRFDNLNDFVENVAIVLDAAADIGVGSLIGADDIAEPQGEHLGTMALVAALCSVSLEQQVKYTDCYVNQQVNLDLAFTEGNEVRIEELDVQVVGGNGQLYSNEAIKLRKSRTVQGANLSLMPVEPGFLQVRIYCQGSELPASPISLQVHTQEETRSSSRAASRAHPENRNPPASTSKYIERTIVSPVSDSRESGKIAQFSTETEVDISHKSFAQRRLHIIKQLEAQHVNHIAQTKSHHQQHTQQQQHHQTVPTQSSSIVQVVQPIPPPPPTLAQSSSNIPPPPPIPAVLEASAYREMPLTRSPDVGLVSFSGLTEPCSVGSIVEVVINAHGDAVSGSVYVEAVSPSGNVHRCTVRHQDNSYMATFTPQEVGLWRIGILYDGEHIRGSPFACQVFDSGLVNVYGLDVGLVGQELNFSVNASQAGHGNLSVTVFRHGREIPLSIEEQGSSKVHQVSFTPDGAGQYKIHVLFNRMEIKGSPFILDIADASSVSVYGENLRSASVGKTASFMVHAIGAEAKDISAHVTGEHSVDVMLADQRVPDAPFACNVGAPDLVHVRNMPRRIQPSKLHTDHSFEIDASAAGSGNLEIMINGGRVPCRVRELGSRQYMAIFTPTQSMTHTIEMRFNGEHVSGSPWKLPVEDRGERRQEMERTMSYYSELSGPGLVRAPVNRTAQFDITGEGLELSDIQAKISGPDNREYPIRIIPRSSGKYTAEYEIEQVGEHHLTVWIAGRKVDGSPLSVAGYATEKVRLEPLGGGVPKQPVQFYVDAVEAGKGQLEISVNQGKVPNNVQMQGAGRCLVTFIPQHAGTYVIDVTFNGEQVHGCPIKVEILPKQVGQQIHANLTPTAVSTAISAGGTSLISGAFRETARSPLSARSPTSPTLLQHARQRSEETMLRSPQLLRESRKADKPWQSSYAPSSSRNAFSQSPHRDWSASTVYDRVYNSNSDVERTLSPSDPSRNRNIRETTTVIHRTPSPTGLRTQEFAERIARSPSPTGYEREFVEKRTTYRSPSPARTSSVAHSHISEVPLSPIQGMDTPFDHHERVKKVERMDPLADEEEREQRRNQLERDSKNTLGYTVAQYGDGEKRYFGDTLEKKDRPPSAGYYSSVQQRSTSPEYSTVYERYDRKSEKPDLPPRVEGHVSASYKGYEPVYSEVTTTRTTTTTEYENIDKKPNVPKKRATTPEGHVEPVNDNEEKDRQAFLRTQSEKVFEPVDAPLRRSDEKESIYDLPPQERLHKYPEEPTIALGEKANTSAIAAYTKGRQDDIDEVSRNASFPSAPTINYNERSDEVSNYNRTKEDHYGVVGEYPTAPKIAYSDSKEAVIREHYAQAKEDPYATVGECPPAPEISLRSDKLNETKNEYRRTTDSDQQDGKAGPPPPVIEISKAEQARRTEEYLRVKSEDDKILAKHGFTRKPEPSIEIQEPVTEQIRDDVVETAIAPEVPLRPVEELPHSPAPSSRSTPATTPKLSAKFRKDGKEGKPFDFGKSKFVCKHDVIKRGKEVEVKLEGIKLGKEDQLRVVVLPPANKAIPGANGGPPTEVDTKVKKSSSKYEISFKPTEVGTHKVFAYVNDMQHPLSPFAVRVYDASEIIVGEIPNQSNLNDTVEFTVDAGRAGFGNLEMAIKDADGVIIPSHVAQLESGSAKFLVTFTPATKGPHTVNITFNKEVLKNSPFEVNIVDAPLPAPVVLEPASGASAVASPSLSKKELKEQEKEKKREEKERAKREKEERATLKKEKKSKSHRFPAKTTVSKIPSLSRVGQPSSLVVEVSGHDQLEIRVLDSKKSEIGTDIVEIEPGHMQINFTPAQVGDHEIDVRYGGVPVTGSPFTCRAYDPAKIKVGAIPKGLLDKPVYFTVDASEAGVGNLEVAVCEGRVPSMAHALGHHKYDISFVPKEDVDHTITVRFNNEPVPGSPFLCQLVATAQATATGAGLERIPVDEETEIQILTDEIDSAPEARVRDPQGNDLPVNVTRSRENETLHIATYVPKCVGNHLIDIFLQGEPIAGSPFTAKAYDARKTVLVPPANAVVGKPATFVIDAARSGAGNMEIIVSVDNRNVPNFVQAEGQARFKVSFTPQDAKDHTISVKFNGISVPGSPLICSVSSAGSVPAAVVLPAAAVIGAETAVAARERIKHTPQHSSEQIKQTTTTVLQKTPEIRETVEKTGLARELNSAQIGQKKGFTIDNINKSSDCNVIITAPDGSMVPVSIQKSSTSAYAEFTPTITGEHLVEIYLDHEIIDEFVIKIKDERHILPPVCLAGQKYSFDVNSDDKNKVRVTIREPSGRMLPVQMEDLPDGGVRVSCRFKEVGIHSIDVFVDDQPIGERKMQTVIDPLNGAQLVSEPKREIVGEQTELKILIDSGVESQVEVIIEGPDREDNEVFVKKVSETLWSAVWTPKVEGEHELSILVAGEQIPGSPFPIHVLDPSAVRVIGLKNAPVGVEQQFSVDYTNSGASIASVEVRHGDQTIPITVKKMKPGQLLCTFTPFVDGPHQVEVIIDGVPLSDGPYEVFISHLGTVRASGDALRKAQRARTARFEVINVEQNRGELDVMVSDPKGGPLPVRCYKQQDDSYWVEFTPEHLGTHTIEVTFGDVPVPGSPFKTEVIDPKNVEIRGLSDQVLLRHATTINVDRRNAGNGELQVEITDPTGSPLRTEMLKSPGGEDRITFLPNQTGPHKINVKVAGFQIPGYPQTILVSEQEKPAVYGAAVDQSIKIGEPASLIFDPKKTNGGLKIHATGPDGQKVHHNVMRRPNGTSEVVFYPEETGTYNVSIDFNNRPITGSPFTVNVVDPTKVIVNDLDMDRDGTLLLRLGHSNSFDVDATAAGPGKLRAEVRDADSSLIGNGPVVEDMGQGKYRVRFNPDQPGKYSIYLYWNELPVESAFPVRARSSAEDLPTTSRAVREPIPPPVTTTYHTREKSSGSNADDEISRIMVRGDGLHRAVLKEHNEFIIDGSDINKEGRITATLLGSKADIPVRIQQLGHNVYKATYTPLTGGTYELHILWNGKHVKGSPFAVSADTSAHLADLIDVDASTLKIGIINENIKTLIDTRRAGSGQLSALCMGPNKPAYCELYDHRDGTYALCVRPAEIGKHTLVIKYDDEHVKGSPFVVHVSLPPDPSKVRVYGPGVEHGILSLFKSNFVVETRGAGAGQLTVRVRGPKGAFNVEMQREKKNERTIHCKYEPKEPGDYQVEVKWHGEHVPGSPFLVMIVDTEKELSRYLRGEAPSPTPATPFIPPGWVAPPQMYPMQPGQQRFLPPPGHFGPMGVPSPYGSVPPPTKHKGRNH